MEKRTSYFEGIFLLIVFESDDNPKWMKRRRIETQVEMHSYITVIAWFCILTIWKKKENEYWNTSIHSTREKSGMDDAKWSISMIVSIIWPIFCLLLYHDRPISKMTSLNDASCLQKPRNQLSDRKLASNIGKII